FGERMQRRVVHALGCEILDARVIVSVWREIRGDIRRVGSNCNGIWERGVLPALRGFARKPGGAEPRAGGCPEAAEVRTRVFRILVEADSDDIASDIRFELDAHLDWP